MYAGGVGAGNGGGGREGEFGAPGAHGGGGRLRARGRRGPGGWKPVCWVRWCLRSSMRGWRTTQRMRELGACVAAATAAACGRAAVFAVVAVYDGGPWVPLRRGRCSRSHLAWYRKIGPKERSCSSEIEKTLDLRLALPGGGALFQRCPCQLRHELQECRVRHPRTSRS